MLIGVGAKGPQRFGTGRISAGGRIIGAGSGSGSAVFLGMNEPAGMTLIDQRPFNTLAEHASPHDPAWDTDIELSITTDATAPHSPSNILHHLFPAGFVDGSSGGHTGMIFGGGYKDLYIAWWHRYSSNWEGHGTGINKLCYLWEDSLAGPPIVMEANGSGTSGPLHPRPITQAWAVDAEGSFDCNIVPAATYRRGLWDLTEYVITGNTAGTHNGRMDWYLNGVKVGDTTSLFPGGVQWSTGRSVWNIFEITPVWGGNDGSTVTANMDLDIDHVYLSGK